MSSNFRWRRVPPIPFLLYLLLRYVLMVVDMFPYAMAPKVGRFLGRIVHFIDRRHVRVASTNLAKVSGVCPADEIPEFVERIYDHLGLSLVEMLMTPRLLERGQVSDHVTVENTGIVDAILKEGRGAIIAIGHLGNWEITGIAVALHGYRLNSLARPIENPWIDRYLNRFRTHTGHSIISKYHALGAMVATLQRNELLVIQIDQDARHQGVFVDFFGRPASTHRSPAVLSLKYGTPIVPVNIFREGNRHRCVVTEAFYPDPYRGLPDPTQALTQAFTRRFEEFVRQHPEQWFWVHRRWKTERPEEKRTEALA
jgi:KDO2-lipid IV(A) lauroyltransferase